MSKNDLSLREKIKAITMTYMIEREKYRNHGNSTFSIITFSNLDKVIKDLEEALK